MKRGLIKTNSLTGETKKPILENSDGFPIWESNDYIKNHVTLAGREDGLLGEGVDPKVFLTEMYRSEDGDFYCYVPVKNILILDAQRRLNQDQIQNIVDNYKDSASSPPNLTPFLENGKVYLACSDYQHGLLARIRAKGVPRVLSKLSYGEDPLIVPALLNRYTTKTNWDDYDFLHSNLSALREYPDMPDDYGIRTVANFIENLGFDVERDDQGNHFGRLAHKIWNYTIQTRLFENPKDGTAIRNCFANLSEKRRKRILWQYIKDVLSLYKIINPNMYSQTPIGVGVVLPKIFKVLGSPVGNASWNSCDYSPFLEYMKKALSNGVWSYSTKEPMTLLTDQDYQNAAIKYAQYRYDNELYRAGPESMGARELALKLILIEMFEREIEKNNKEQVLSMPSQEDMEILSSESQLTHN